jgi:hypothetical protein
VPTAVLWRPGKCFDTANVVIEAFLPVFGLFGVVLVGCFVAGIVTVFIEVSNPKTVFFEENSASKRKQELLSGKPFGRGFTFSMNSTFQLLCTAIDSNWFCLTLVFSDSWCWFW